MDRHNTTMLNQQEQEFLWLQSLQSLVIENLADTNLTNEHLAKQLQISNRTLYRIVRRHTGQSPNQYVRDIRLEKAYELLSSREYTTVKEVVAMIGFKKTAYFSRLFKDKYGINPSYI